MSILIGSDLHFKDADDPVLLGFVNLLKEKSDELERLVLAGDIFDLFVGQSKYLQKKFQPFFDVLRDLDRRGVKIDYIEGNHDFQLHGLFSDFKNTHLHQEEVLIDHGGTKLYVAHGDLVDDEDLSYLRMRRFFRSHFAKGLSNIIPGRSYDLLKRAFDVVRPKRENPDSDRKLKIRKKFHSFARSKFNEGIDVVVLGHCHDLDGFEEIVDGNLRQYLNMGFPPRDKFVIVWNPAQSKFERHLFIK